MAGARISRRSVLGTVSAASLAPMLPQPAAARLLPAGEVHPRAAPAFHAELEVAAASVAVPGERVARITGGRVAGRLLSGQVEGGSIWWRDHPAGQEVTARFAVRTGEGWRLEVVERGFLGAAQPGRAATLSTSTELLAPDSGLPESPSLLVGRLDLGRLGEGTVSLSTYEVS